LRQRALDEDRIHKHEAVLEHLQRQCNDLLLLPVVRRKFALPAIAKEIVCSVPVLG
jgi:hypothetical protein